jgi:hypothetical protein
MCMFRQTVGMCLVGVQSGIGLEFDWWSCAWNVVEIMSSWIYCSQWRRSCRIQTSMNDGTEWESEPAFVHFL